MAVTYQLHKHLISRCLCGGAVFLLAVAGASFSGQKSAPLKPSVKTQENTDVPINTGDGIKTTLQIGGISMHQGRVWISGLVLSGAVGEKDTLEALGVARRLCVVDEVLVGNTRKKASRGEECQIFLSNPDVSFARDGTKLYMALAGPGAVSTGTALRAALTWASLDDGPLPSAHYAPAVKPINEDTRVELRFVDIRVSGVLKKPVSSNALVQQQEVDLWLDRKVPVIPEFGFTMNINGQFAATGKVIGIIDTMPR
jgi:hypothetical protein